MLPCNPAVFNPDSVIKSLKSSFRIHGSYGCVELEICNKFESWSTVFGFVEYNQYYNFD